MQIVVDQLLTNYQLAGKGKIVVVLHGWGDSSKSFTTLAGRLADKYNVLTIDLPGFGGTQAPKTTWGLEDYAVFVAAVLAKLQLKPYAIIGHSNGGAIAIRGLAKNLLSAQKLVLLASAGVRNQYNARNKSLRMVAKAGKLLTSPLPQHVQRKLRTKAYKAVGSDMFVAEHLQETFKKIVTDDVQADAAAVDIPSLLIYGDQDTATPLRYAHLLRAALPHATLEVIPEAGHFVFVDAAERTSTIIEEFLR